MPIPTLQALSFQTITKLIVNQAMLFHLGYEFLPFL
jgi:hypothetical protein